MNYAVNPKTDHWKIYPMKEAMEAIQVKDLQDGSTTDFDLYIEAGERLVLYAKAPYAWTHGELERLLADKHQALYYSTADRVLVDTYRLVHSRIVIDESLPPPVRIARLTDAAAELTRILYAQPLTTAALGRVGDIAQAMVTCVETDPTCIRALGKLANHDHYTYYHSARVAAYALAIALKLTSRETTQLTEMTTGALLHDIGKSRIDLAVLNKAGPLTPDEWVLMKEHPVHGGAIVADSLLSVVPRSIILQHHERFDGSGYPHQLSERELLDEVKIASFADVFDALTTNRPYHESRTPFEALDFIRHKLLKNLHKDSFRAMTQLLGVETLKKSG